MDAPVGPDVDRDDRVRLLLVGNDRPAAGSDEAVVVEVEVDAVTDVPLRRKAPEPPMGLVNQEDPVVPSIGDQKGSLERPACALSLSLVSQRPLLRRAKRVVRSAGEDVRVRCPGRPGADSRERYEEHEQRETPLATPAITGDPAAHASPPATVGKVTHVKSGAAASLAIASGGSRIRL